MRSVPWSVAPEELGTFDAAVLRCIAGELSESSMMRLTGQAGLNLRRRMALLVQRHHAMRIEDLARLQPDVRRRLATDILRAEIDERDTAPGELVPLRGVAR